MKVLREVYEDEGYLFVLELSWESDGSRPTWIDVKCAEGHRRKGSRLLTDNVTWESRPEVVLLRTRWDGHDGPEQGEDYVEDFSEAQLLFRVVVKWDKCAHWEFGPQRYDEEDKPWGRGDGYIHTCSDDLRMLDAMNTAYNRAKKIMLDAGTWDE